MHTFVSRRSDEFGRSQSDAVVNDFHADVACLHGDLLGAVTVSIESGLADQEFDAATECG